jgi:hypothetical protein
MLLRQYLDSKDEENLLLEVGSKYCVGICKRKRMRSLYLFANFLDQAKKWEGSTWHQLAKEEPDCLPTRSMKYSLGYDRPSIRCFSSRLESRECSAERMLLRQHLDSKDEENLLLEVGSKYCVGICKRKRMRSLDLFANFLDQAKKWERKSMASISIE